MLGCLLNHKLNGLHQGIVPEFAWRDCRNRGKQNVGQDNRYSGRDFNWISADYKLEALPPEPL
jgi:hypothetical protein